MLSARPVGLPLDADRGIPTKTPGRVLTKTQNVLQENAVHNASMTVTGKGGKAVQNTPLHSKTLQTVRVFKEPPGKQLDPSKLKDTLAVRPLGDKTPFPNRTVNQPSATGAKTAKPALFDGSLRPSSARKHDRLPRSASKVFETPVTDGKHWDVSDIEIQVETPAANHPVEEESCDEIEYMPPKVDDIPYEPPFEMPNYREVGKTLMALIRSYTIEDDPPSTDITFTVDASESKFFVPPSLPQQEIEDDSPFARAKPVPQAKSRPSTTTPKQTSAATSKPSQRPLAQRIMPGTRKTAPASSRVPPTIRRPTTATTARPPATALRASASQPVTRAPTSQSTLRAPTSRATTRAPSATRSTPLVRAGTVQLPRTTSLSRPTIKSGALATTAPSKTTTTQPNGVPAARNPALSTAGRPRSGTITKAAFESNTHVVVHIRNNSLEDVKKDLEGLIVFEDAFDEDDGFRFDV